MELIAAIYTAPIGFHPELLGWWMIWDIRITIAATFTFGAFITARGIYRRVRDGY